MMKNYRPLVPILFVLLMAASIYMMISGARNQQKEINELLQKAENCSEQGLYDKAAGYYNEVIGLDNSIKHYLAVADMYYEAEKYDYSAKWCEKILEVFPKEPEAYERAIKAYLKSQSYSEAFDTLEQFDGRRLHSQEVEAYRNTMDFLYYEDYCSFDDVTVVSAGCVGSHNKNGWGLASAKGASIVAPRFEQIGFFANDMVPVCESENVWYFMNREGEYIYNLSDAIPGTITEVGLYNNELFPVCADGKYRYYTLDFNSQFEEYEYAGSFSSGVAAVKNNLTWRLIKNDGVQLTEEGYQDVILDERGVCCQQNRIFVKKDGVYIMLDSDGNRIGTETFENAKAFSGGEYAAVMVDGLWGYVDLSGELIIEPKYDDAKSFSLNLAPVLKNGLWGYIDASENLVVKPQYTKACAFSDSGAAFVRAQDQWEIIKLYKYNH